MKIFVTGGTGFFGKALLRHIKQVGLAGFGISEFTILSRTPKQFKARYPDLSNIDGVEFVAGDVLKPETLPINNKFSHVLHAATESTYGPKLSPLNRFNQILHGTQNILDFSERVGASKLLLTSSGGVYGETSTDNLLSECMPTSLDVSDEKMSYSIGKLAAEHISLMWGAETGCSVAIARCFAFVGEDLPRDVHFAIGNFIEAALNGQEISLSSDGSSVRSYMYQDDLAEWLLQMLVNEKCEGIYNVGSDEPISIYGLARLVSNIESNGCIQVSRKEATSNQARRFYVPNVDKARTKLGLKSKYDLRSSILNTLQKCRRYNA